MDAQRESVADLASVAPGVGDAPGAELRRLPGRVAATYAVLAAAWIIGTDLVVGAASSADLGGRLVDIAKGLLFVGVTAVALRVVLARVTERFDRVVLRALTGQRDFLASVLSTTSDAMVILDGEGRTLWANDRTAAVLGWAPAELVGTRVRELVHPVDVAASVGFRREAEAADRPSSPRSFLLRHRDGSYRSMELRAAPIPLADGVRGIVVNGVDVTDRARSDRQLRAALATDVTGLPGLRMLVAEIDLIEQLRPEGLVATVAVADVDRFGDVNDLHGRDGGDAVLRELARRIEAAVPEALGVWRHGADEFTAIVLEDAEHPDGDPHDLAERIRSAADAPVVLDERGAAVPVELSVGVARVEVVVAPDGEALSASLLRAGERALVEAKAHPDRIAVHLPGAAPRSSDRARMAAQLHDAVERGELVVHYQPKVALDTREVGGVEALVRWQHPERGLVMPDEFLDVVAEANRSAALLRIVLDDALTETARWLERAGVRDDFAVCVNVSADDLRRRRFADDVHEALERSGVPARHLCLELTERLMVADAAAASAVVADLRRAGVQVAIDDFGTGYSTLEHIRTFEVDELKIDKGFVQRLSSSAADAAIVDTVISIGQRLGVRVVAEGVEDEATHRYLAEKGCGFGQGYLFGRPGPAADVDVCGPVGRP